ncbi:non-ribosomal peptide synthetase [Nocardia sp. NPDC051990]|uniref:non-ribosomal peptide synthetase n=1 Tax=Nocardia sp. NPDC051990 TaxID=3155285 RepID=UPI0034455391
MTGTAPAVPNHLTVAELFQQRVARSPEAIAVVHKGIRLTYGALDERSMRLAHRLRAHGVRRGELVAVLLDSSIDLIVAALAVVRSGAGYIPLSVRDPLPRIESILRDAGAGFVLTDDQVPDAGRARILRIGDEADNPRGTPGAASPPTPHDIAYVIFTSGSTGRPKGVVIEHAALATYLSRAIETYPGLAGRVLLHTSPSFDLAVTSMFGPLVTGGTIEITTLDTAAGGPGPSLLKGTPAHMTLLRTEFPHCSPTADLVVGGEALLASTVDAWRRDNPGVTVYNEYGPTEATVGCCLHRIPPDTVLEPGAVPIGRAFDGTELRTLDPELRPVTVGELYIAGAQLARGYLDMPGRTALAFVADPFGPSGSRMYRTGDRVRRRGDDLLEFVERIDDQVKINGIRVEPAEVADALARADQVAAVAVTARAQAGARRLVAYVVPAAGAALDTTALRGYLLERVPTHLVPASIVVVDTLPLNTNGKVDFPALPDPGDPYSESNADARTAPETVLCRLIADLVGVETVGIDDDFFALGGTSLDAARLVTRARRDGLALTLTDVLDKRTVRRLVEP